MQFQFYFNANESRVGLNPLKSYPNIFPYNFCTDQILSKIPEQIFPFILGIFIFLMSFKKIGSEYTVPLLFSP